MHVLPVADKRLRLNRPRFPKIVVGAAVVLGAIVTGQRLEFAPRFPTAPDAGSWVNPYEATDRVTGERFEVCPRLMEHGTDVD